MSEKIGQGGSDSIELFKIYKELRDIHPKGLSY